METPEPEQKRRMRALVKDIFEPNAPPNKLPFPASANFAAYEILSLLPNSLRCPGMVYRLASNGAMRRALWAMINTARDPAKEWNPDRCGALITRTMTDAGYTGWITTKHDQWHEENKASWNENSLNVGSFQTPEESRGAARPDVNVPFKSLVTSVRRMPNKSETLDLTRMVQYCNDNPTEDWLYPRDYYELLELLDGPRPFRAENLDRAAFEQWDEVKPLPRRTWSAAKEDAARQTLKAKYPKRTTGNKAFGTTDADALSRQSTPGAEARPKRKGNPRKRLRLEEADTEEDLEEMDMLADKDKHKAEIELGDDKADKKTRKEVYIRPPIAYVAPPDVATAPTLSDVVFACSGQGIVGETNPFSPYAFDESRLAPPYRMLHGIEDPENADVSGFAENLRWASEQRAYYRGTRQVEGWNESPAHMDLIGQVLQTRVWASDELLPHVSRLQEMEEEMGRGPWEWWKKEWWSRAARCPYRLQQGPPRAFPQIL